MIDRQLGRFRLHLRGQFHGYRSDRRAHVGSPAGGLPLRAARDRPNVLEKLYGVSLRGHATTIVDARVHPTTGVLTTKDASGVCRAWRRDARGEVEIADETTDADAAEAIECARMERCGSGASVAARAHVGGRDVEASSERFHYNVHAPDGAYTLDLEHAYDKMVALSL